VRCDVGGPNVIILPYKVRIYAEMYVLLGVVIIFVRAVVIAEYSMLDYSSLFYSEKVLQKK
jgi:hypothetical protein